MVIIKSIYPIRKAGRAIVLLLLMTFTSISPSLLNGQDPPPRPKLGLALSGGGAKGLAHIGVLMVMEEAGLTPDYITGVSMGSIVGGIYAMGYSPDSIATIFRAFDWDAALSDRIPENKIIFLEKRHYFNSILSLPITRNAIKIPSGLINGQQIESGLNYYLWPAAGISDFSQLPVPYLCLATDVITSKKVVFRSGYLPDAIRASMSIPTVFTAIRTDTAVLVDGGVVRNFAVTELREMGADIVIGSYVSFRGASEKDLESAYGILKQIGFLTSLADFEEQKRLTDIMIEPDMKDYSTMSFSDVDSLINRGYREALKYKDQFISLANSLNAMGPGREMTRLPDISYYEFDRIRVTGNSIISDAQIIGVLDIQPGQRVERDMLAERIELLYGKAWFEKVKYRIIPHNDTLILEIDCIERPQAMLYGSLHYDPALSSGVVLNLSVRDLITPSSVINAESFIGQYYRFRLGIMQFIDRSQKFGVEATFYTDNTRLPIVRLRNETGPMLSQNIITGLSLSKRLSLNHLMTLSATIEDQQLIPDYITTTNIRKLSHDYLRFAYGYQANTLDYKHFPNHGTIYCLSASSAKLYRGTIKTETGKEIFNAGDESAFSFDRFYTARASIKSYVSPSRRVTLNFGGELLMVSAADSITSNNNLFYLGGLDPVTDRSIQATGFHANQIAVKALGGITFGTDLEIATDLHLTISGNIFALKEPERMQGASLLAGWGIGLGYMSIAGPIRIGIMHGIYEKELLYRQVKGYVSIGFNF